MSENKQHFRSLIIAKPPCGAIACNFSKDYGNFQKMQTKMLLLYIVPVVIETIGSRQSMLLHIAVVIPCYYLHWFNIHPWIYFEGVTITNIWASTPLSIRLRGYMRRAGLLFENFLQRHVCV